MAVGRCRAVCRRRERSGGEKRFTAAGRGERARRRELLDVVPRWRTEGRVGRGVVSSEISEAGLELSGTSPGVIGGGNSFLELELRSSVSHK